MERLSDEGRTPVNVLKEATGVRFQALENEGEENNEEVAERDESACDLAFEDDMQPYVQGGHDERMLDETDGDMEVGEGETEVRLNLESQQSAAIGCIQCASAARPPSKCCGGALICLGGPGESMAGETSAKGGRQSYTKGFKGTRNESKVIEALASHLEDLNVGCRVRELRSYGLAGLHWLLTSVDGVA